MAKVVEHIEISRRLEDVFSYEGEETSPPARRGEDRA